MTKGLLGWADIIFCMEKKHLRRIQEKYQDELIYKKVIVLYINDDYEYMDPELISILESTVITYIL